MSCALAYKQSGSCVVNEQKIPHIADVPESSLGSQTPGLMRIKIARWRRATGIDYCCGTPAGVRLINHLNPGSLIATQGYSLAHLRCAEFFAH